METRAPSRYQALIDTLLQKRGLHAKTDIETFLSPDYDTHTHDFTLMHDIERAAERICNAIGKEERIAIYTDFDCDGIPGAVVLHDLFTKLGYENVVYYIPHRQREGYGLHTEAIEELAQDTVSLIVTVDVGVGSYEAVEEARRRGIDVIVTDHHEIPAAPPKAYALVHPAKGKYPYKELCGAAVAYKLVQAVLAHGRAHNLDGFADIADGWEKWLLDMVGIATIADMVPLTGENRVLARYGLTVLRKSPRPGVIALCRKLRIRQEDLTEDDIGFMIAPRINAASRMDEPELAFRLLSTNDVSEAEGLATELERLNRKRKGVAGSMTREAKRRMHERVDEKESVFTVGSPEWMPSLTGLVANSLMEERGGAVCIWGRDARGRIKGSCRSDGTIHIVGMFESARSALEEFGGHECAGGFTVKFDAIHTLPVTFSEAASSARGSGRTDADAYDADIVLSDVSWELVRELMRLAPFGMGNPKPVFRLADVRVSDVRVFGKEGNHTEVYLGEGNGGDVRGFQFFVTPDAFTRSPSPGMRANVLATLERDTFRGSQQVALRVIDII